MKKCRRGNIGGRISMPRILSAAKTTNNKSLAYWHSMAWALHGLPYLAHRPWVCCSYKSTYSFALAVFDTGKSPRGLWRLS
jgi:hypothetical protein